FEATANELAAWLYALAKVQELSDELGRDVSIGLEGWALPAQLYLPQAVLFGRPLVIQGAPAIDKHPCPSCDPDVSPGMLQLMFTVEDDHATKHSARLARGVLQAFYKQALALEQV